MVYELHDWADMEVAHLAMQLEAMVVAAHLEVAVDGVYVVLPDSGGGLLGDGGDGRDPLDGSVGGSVEAGKDGCGPLEGIPGGGGPSVSGGDVQSPPDTPNTLTQGM